MSAIAFDIEAAPAVEGLATDAVTGGNVDGMKPAGLPA
jgi:hypothetical protein